MPFPATERVIYKKNPLDHVVCQLRFTPILRIDAEVPASFQDKIRREFPNFAEATEVLIELPSEGNQQVPLEFVGQAIKTTNIKNYTFTSEDELWRINLTRTFLALSTTKYKKWEEFKKRLEIPFNALMDVYDIPSFTRIGLRYVDVIKRSDLGLDGVPWSELLQPYVAGIQASPEIEKWVKAFDATYNIGLGTNIETVRMVTKLVKAKDTDEIYFVIDSDFYNNQKTIVQDIFTKLDYLNTRASRLIRWAISERLHEAMGPESI